MTHPILNGPIVQPTKNPLDDFDPNVKPKAPFATYCPTRRNNGAFKTHGTRASALNALRFQGYGILYVWEGQLWVEIARFDRDEFRKDRCENCQKSTLRDEHRWDYVSRRAMPTGRKINGSVQTFVRSPNGKLADPLQVVTLCGDCKSGLGY